MIPDDSAPIVAPVAVESVADIESFVLWAIRQLGLDVARHGAVCRLVVPEGAAALDEQSQMAFTFERCAAEEVTGTRQSADGPQSLLGLRANATTISGSQRQAFRRNQGPFKTSVTTDFGIRHCY